MTDGWTLRSTTPDTWAADAARDVLALLSDHAHCELKAAHSALALVGPSGSGKSSLLAAGLLPALRLGKVPGSESWIRVAVTVTVELVPVLGTVCRNSIRSCQLLP